MKNNRINIISDDNEQLYLSQKSWGSLRNKTVLVTGATGMLAACMVRFFVYLNRKDQLNIRVLLLARSEQKVQDLFGELTGEFECFTKMFASRLSLMTKSISLFMRRAMQAHIISNTILLGLFRPTLLEP